MKERVNMWIKGSITITSFRSQCFFVVNERLGAETKTGFKQREKTMKCTRAMLKHRKA